MRVILSDGIKKGESFELPKMIKDGSVFPVILTENSKYQYAEYVVIPARTRLNERMAKFVGMVER